MITLNLLSPAQKEALRSRVFFSLLERLMIVALAAVLLGSILLLAIKVELTKNLQGVQARQVLTADYAKANSDIKLLNQQFGRFDALQKLAYSPSSLLRDIAARTPDGIQVTGITFDITSSSMRINGTAARREDLLAYETSMKASPFVKDLTSPISNLFEKTDITFYFDIVLNVDALHAPFEPAP